MRIGISTACFYPMPLEETLSILKGLRVKIIEVFVNAESEFDPKFYSRFGEDAAKSGLEILSVHPYTSIMEGLLLFSEYRRRTADGLKHYRRYFECAKALGAKFLTFHGEREMGFKDTPERWERKCEVYHRLCALGGSEGVTLAQENVNWCRSREPEFIKALSRDVPELKYTLDIKQARRAGKDWKSFVDIERERLVNIHINDYSEEKSCLLPGRGGIDYGEFFSYVRGAGYKGDAIIEVYGSDYSEPAELGEAARFLSGIAAQGA